MCVCSCWGTVKALLAAQLGADLGSASGPQLPDIERAWAAWGWPPDIVVIEIGLNDALSATPAISETLWPARYGALLDSLQASGATVVAATPFAGVGPLHPRYAAVARYAQYIRAEAGARGIMVADLWVMTRDCAACISHPNDESPFGPLFRGDDFHPSDVGHQLIALTMLRALRPYTVYMPL